MEAVANIHFKGLPIGFILVDDSGHEFIITEKGWELANNDPEYVAINEIGDDTYECKVLIRDRDTRFFDGIYVPSSDSDEPEPEKVYEKPKRGRKPKPGPRRTRKPTAYNLFIKDVMPRIKLEFPGLSNNERMIECSKLWQSRANVNQCE
jgi:hypothetical protein